MILSTTSRGENLGLQVIESGTITEPVSLPEAKAYLKVEHDLEDGLITLMIKSSREAVERYMNQSVVAKTLTASWTRYSEYVELPYGPHNEVTEVVRINDNEETVLTENTDFYISGTKYKTIAAHTQLTSSGYLYHALKVTYTTTGLSDASIKLAILKQLATDYENRENYNETSLTGEAKKYLKRRYVI